MQKIHYPLLLIMTTFSGVLGFATFFFYQKFQKFSTFQHYACQLVNYINSLVPQPLSPLALAGWKSFHNIITAIAWQKPPHGILCNYFLEVIFFGAIP